MKAGDKRLTVVLLLGGFLVSFVWSAIYWQVLDLATYPPKWIVLAPYTIGIAIMWLGVANYTKNSGFRSRTSMSVSTFAIIVFIMIILSSFLVLMWISFGYL